MKKIYALLISTLLALTTQVYGQVAGSFDIITMKWRWTSTTVDYLNNNGYTTGARIMGHPVIYGSGDKNKANLESVRTWLVKEFPSTTSTGYLILNWETGPYVTMRNNLPTSSAFKAAESEVLRLINEVKRVRPNVKVSMYMMPYRFWLQSQNGKYNGTGKFDNIFAKVDFIAPSYYIMYADEEVGHERNLQYLRENLTVALEYGKKFNKPVIPFVWHKIHPTTSNGYDGEIMQKEVFAKYIKYISTYSYNNYKAAGVWWYDGLADQFKDLSGINDFLNGTVYDKATYNAMIVDYAKHVKQVLNEQAVTAPAPAGQRLASFTLINADTDKDIQTLTSGATLNLAVLPTKNLAIRANTSPATVGSVVFRLSGAQSKSITENKAPYALHADDDIVGYRAWVPATGSYTLKATPYTSSGGKGTAGTALTISFTVVNKAVTTASAAAMASESSAPDPEQAADAFGGLSVYPNPATTVFHIEVAEAETGVYTFEIHDFTGKPVQTKIIDNEASSFSTLLDISALQKGLYILKTGTPAGKRVSQRLAVE